MVDGKTLQSTVPCNAARAAITSKIKLNVHAKPSLVILRLKRKRTDEPVKSLVVQSEPNSKRVRTNLLEAFTQLSTTKKRFVFKHIDTMEKSVVSGHVNWTQRLKRKAHTLKEKHADMMAKMQFPPVFQKDCTASNQLEKRVKQQQSRSKVRRNEEVLKSRSLQSWVKINEKQTIELPGIRVVDLQLSTVSSPFMEKEMDDIAVKSQAEVVTINGATMKPKRVLNPYERELDEAIWTAFRANDFASFFRIYQTRRPDHLKDPSTYQRLTDGCTILMSAALHGRSDVIEVLLRSASLRVLQQDWEGATAATFAKRGGHTNVEIALRACEEAENEKAYVYDVYCIDPGASLRQDTLHDATTVSTDEYQQSSDNGVPVVEISSEVHRWLSEDMVSDEVEEYMLESDLDSSEDDGLSEDSNDEDNAANDYPDEESSGESQADSDDLDEIGARRRWESHENECTERNDCEY